MTGREEVTGRKRFGRKEVVASSCGWMKEQLVLAPCPPHCSWWRKKVVVTGREEVTGRGVVTGRKVEVAGREEVAPEGVELEVAAVERKKGGNKVSKWLPWQQVACAEKVFTSSYTKLLIFIIT